MKITPYAPFVSVREKEMPFYVATVGNPKFQPRVNRPQGISDDMFLYTVRGCGTCIIGGKAHEMRAGTVLYLPSAAPHMYYPRGEEWETVYITFNGAAVKGFLRETASVFETDEQYPFEDICRQIYAAKKNPEAYPQTSKLLYGLMVDLREQMRDGRFRVIKKENILSEIMNLIADDPDVRLADIAQRFHVSEAYFCRIFKRHTGYHLTAYLNILKISRAAKLLRETETDISEIAVLVGYASHSYFTAQFKKHMGITPRAYREMDRG